MSASEAQKRATDKYHSKFDDIKVRPPKGTKNRWRAAAEARGLSLQKFIIDTVETEIKKGPEV